MTKTIGLCMIVRDETDVLKRALLSVKPIIDYWCIVHTRSNIETKNVIYECLSDIPGLLYEEPWVNFEVNRNDSLAYIKGKTDYILILDADETYFVDPTFNKENLVHDAYDLEGLNPGVQYRRRLLFRNGLDWYYVGTVHEYLECRDKINVAFLPELKFILHGDPWTYDHSDRNLQLLLEGHQKEPHNSRYVFYLANTYRDIKDFTTALVYYDKAIQLCAWDEEKFYSMYMKGFCHEQLKNFSEAVFCHMDAYQYKPSRAETLYRLTEIYWNRGNNKLSLMYALEGNNIPLPADGLFIEPAIYDYLFVMYISLNYYWLGDYQNALSYCNKLAGLKIPDHVKKRNEENTRLCQQKIKEDTIIKLGGLLKDEKIELYDRKFSIGGNRRLVIQVPAAYDGLGDHLFFSHIPKIAKQTGRYKEVYVSNFNRYKTSGTKELVWEMNGFVDGFVDEPGTFINKDIIFSILNRYDGLPVPWNICDNLMLAYDLDDGLRDHRPEVYYAPTCIDWLEDKVVFDPNWKHNAGVTHDYVKRFCENINIDFQFLQLGNSNYYGLDDIPIINSNSNISLFEYCNIIASCKEFWCLMSGGALLALALGKMAHIIDHPSTTKIYKFENINKHYYAPIKREV